jgi:O-antigen ligase
MSRVELILTLAVIALIGITPMGREATSGPVLIAYRLLLIVITFVSLRLTRRSDQLGICPGFVGLCAMTLVLMLVSAVWNPGSLFDGFYRWYQFLLFGVSFLALAAANRDRSTRSKRILLYAVIGITLVYLFAAIIVGRRPFIGPFVNPNYYASFLLVGFSGAIAVMFFDTVQVRRVAGGVAAALLYYGMTQAWSRGATVCAVAVAAIAIFRFTKIGGLSRIKVATLLVVVLIAGALASPILLRKFLDRGGVDPYNYQRPKIWLAAIQVIAGHPWLGVGPGEFYYVSKRYSPPVEGTLARYLKRPAIAHSEYLQEAAECGIPAALLMFGLAGYLFYLANRRAPRCSPEDRVLQEAAILSTIGIGLHAFVDNNWTVPVMAAGLVVFSLGNVLPLREWRLTFEWSPRTRLALATLLAVVVIHGIFVPGVAVAFNDAGQKAYKLQDTDRAESMYRLAAAIAPGNSVFLNNAGIVYLDKFLMSRDPRWLNYAEFFFNDASAANPNADQPRHDLEHLLIQRLTGNPERDRQVHMRIIQVDREILRIDPVNPFIRKNLAEALYNVGDHENAEEELNRAVEFEPNFIPGYLRLEAWCRASGDSARGDAYRKRAIAVAVKYENETPKELYESLLLGRVQP